MPIWVAWPGGAGMRRTVTFHEVGFFAHRGQWVKKGSQSPRSVAASSHALALRM
jgi:hypothetical protein